MNKNNTLIIIFKSFMMALCHTFLLQSPECDCKSWIYFSILLFSSIVISFHKQKILVAVSIQPFLESTPYLIFLINYFFFWLLCIFILIQLSLSFVFIPGLFWLAQNNISCKKLHSHSIFKNILQFHNGDLLIGICSLSIS